MSFNPNTITSIAIGGFDGIHVGHLELLKRLDANGAMVAIDNSHIDLTPGKLRERFCPVPIHYIQLEEIFQLSGQEFIELLTQTFPRLEKIVVGYDFHFGYRRQWNASHIADFFPGKVEIVEEVMVGGVSVHSRTIRNHLRLGQVEKANTLLGREYMIVGDVIRGQGIGMRQLYPTLNLHVDGFLLPGEGVFTTRTKVGESLYPSVSFVGHRVSTDGSFAIETHVLDKLEHFAAPVVELYFVDKIRDNALYDDLEALKKRIALDIETAKEHIRKADARHR